MTPGTGKITFPIGFGVDTENFNVDTHMGAILKQLNLLWIKSQFCDAILISGLDNKRISVHRIVLSASSPYFLSLFTDTSATNENEYTINDVNMKALEVLINFCYTGSIQLCTNSVEDVMITASALQLTEVANACSNFLMRRLDPSNFLDIAHLGDRCQHSILVETADEFVKLHFNEICKSFTFLKLSVGQIRKLISSDDLNVATEEEVFNGVMIWVNNDIEEREKYLPELLSVIRIPLLSTKFINENLKPICESIGCPDILVDTLLNRLLPNKPTKMKINLIKPRKSHSIKNFLVVAYYSEKTDILRYSIDTEKWSSIVKSISTTKNVCGCCMLNERMLIFDETNIICLNLQKKNEEPFPNLKTERWWTRAVVLNDCLYVLGGIDSANKYLGTVERWDPFSRNWFKVADMITPRSWFGVIALGNLIYVVGGRNDTGLLNTVECFNPKTNSWMNLAPMQRIRTSPGIVTDNRYIYVIGGIGIETVLLSSIERYDPRSNSWLMLRSLTTAMNVHGCSYINNKLYVIGDHEGKTKLKILEIYDIAKNVWSKGKALPEGYTKVFVTVASLWPVNQ